MSQLLEIGKSFDRVAHLYERSAKVQNEIGQRLFERLDYIKLNPARILDLGCGAGQFSLALKKRYPKARVYAIDISSQMLREARTKQSLWRKWSLIEGDMSQLPFADESFDLIFSNQAVHWVGEQDDLFAELYRVSDKNGCLMFSTLGPDTFKELRATFKQIDAYAHVNEFKDMHDIGDSLLRNRFSDPVMDMSYLTIRYPTVQALLTSLKKQGIKNMHPERKPGLSGKGFLEKLVSHYQAQFLQDDKIPLTYEVVYGHAWRGEYINQTIGQETFVPINQIQRRGR